ncbi:hypothetical protein [Flavobacterium sp. CGRL2]
MKNYLKFISTVIIVLISTISKASQPFITEERNQNVMVLKEKSLSLSLWVNPNLDAGILRAVNNLQSDFEKVTGQRPNILNQNPNTSSPLIIIGMIGTNSVIDDLIKQKKNRRKRTQRQK